MPTVSPTTNNLPPLTTTSTPSKCGLAGKIAAIALLVSAVALALFTLLLAVGVCPPIITAAVPGALAGAAFVTSVVMFIWMKRTNPHHNHNEEESKGQTPAFREDFPQVLIPEILSFSDLNEEESKGHMPGIPTGNLSKLEPVSEPHSSGSPGKGPAAIPDELEAKEVPLELKSTKNLSLTDSESAGRGPAGITGQTPAFREDFPQDSISIPAFREVIPQDLIPGILSFSGLYGIHNFSNISKLFKRQESSFVKKLAKDHKLPEEIKFATVKDVVDELEAKEVPLGLKSTKDLSLTDSESAGCNPAGITGQMPAFREYFPQDLIPGILSFSDLNGAKNFFNTSKRFKRQESSFVRKLAKDHRLPKEVKFTTVKDVVDFLETIHALAVMHFPDIPTPPDILTSYDSSIRCLLETKDKTGIAYKSSKWKQPKVVQYLLQKWPLPNLETLFEMAKVGNVEIVQTVLQTVLQRIPQEEALDDRILDYAAERRNLEIFQTDLQRKLKRMLQTKRILAYLAGDKNLETFKPFLSFYECKAFGEYALHQAIEGGNVEIVQTVLQRIPQEEALDEDTLKAAAKGGNIEIFKAVLQRMPQEEALDEFVLLRAIEGGNIEIVQTVLQRIPQEEALGKYALREAVEGGNIEIFKAVLQRIPQEEALDEDTLKAAAKGGNIEIFKAVLQRMPQEEALDEFVLLRAIEGGNIEIFQTVLQRIPQEEALRRYMLHWSIVRTVLQHIHQEEALGECALHQAIEGRNIEIFQTILQRMPQWKALDDRILAYAAERRNLEIVQTDLQRMLQTKRILAYLAGDKNLETFKPFLSFYEYKAFGEYALHQAIEGGNVEIVQTVLQRTQHMLPDPAYPFLNRAAEAGNLEIFRAVLQRVPKRMRLDRGEIFSRAASVGPKMVLGVKRLLDQRQREREASDSA